MTKISSKSIVAASANQKIPVSPDNAISPNTIKIYADAAVDLTTVQAVALGASADDGTLYRITGTGGSPLPTGIDNILIWGASSTAGGFDYGNARALVTALGVYVPCTYDVATNVIYCAPKIKGVVVRNVATDALSVTILESDYVGVTFTVAYSDFGSGLFDVLITASSAILNASTTIMIGQTMANLNVEDVLINSAVTNTTDIQLKAFTMNGFSVDAISNIQFAPFTIINPL